MKLCILFISSCVIALVNAYIDYYIIKKKWGKITSLNHTFRFFIRANIFTIPSILLYDSIFKMCIAFIYSSLIFWIVFDVYLNYLRGLPTLYVGKTSWIDKVQRNKNIGVIFLVKIICSIILSIWILLI